MHRYLPPRCASNQCQRNLWGAIMLEGEQLAGYEPTQNHRASTHLVRRRFFVGGLLYAILKGWEPEKWPQFRWVPARWQPPS
jgi:hypothetical protein